MTVKKIVEENIISLLKMDYLPLEKKAELLDKIEEVVTKSVLLRVRDAMSETKKAEFDKVLEKGADEDLQDFITKNVPGFLIILGEEIERIKKSMADSLK